MEDEVICITERKCPDCGQTADIETGFIVEGLPDKLYCFECCPEGYGE